jgi:hypothetical protein
MEESTMSYPETLPDDPYWQEDLAEAQGNVNNFEEPDDSMSYSDYRYVGAHNAHVYHRLFETVRQQDQTTIGHLTFGVRGLMWDTYDWNDNLKPAVRLGTGDVILSHETPGSFLPNVQKLHNWYQTLKYELRRVVEFMKENEKAVVTIILEDRADKEQTAAEIKEVMAEAELSDGLIFRPEDKKNFGKSFPTLGWMRSNNRRLVIFTQHAANTDVTFNEFKYCYENGYGTSDERVICAERPESKRIKAARSLVVFNHFPGPDQGSGVTPTVDMQKWRVTYATAKEIIYKAQAVGFAKSRLPNGYWADRVVDCVNQLKSDGTLTIFDYVNKLNDGYTKAVKVDHPYYFFNSSTTRQLAEPNGGYAWGTGDAYFHRLEPVDGGGDSFITDGMKVYIKEAGEGSAGKALNAEGWKNLSYSSTKGGDEEWVIERVDRELAGYIQKGEWVRFKSVRQTRDQNAPRYLSAESDGYLATRSTTDKAAENLGIEWVLGNDASRWD